jgi:hypothetical protein
MWLLGGGLLAGIIAGLASPEIGGLEKEIIKCGVASLVMSKMSKAIGEKEIAEIISGCGWLIVGFNLIKICQVISRFIKG